jgi:hypothetical protein
MTWRIKDVEREEEGSVERVGVSFLIALNSSTEKRMRRERKDKEREERRGERKANSYPRIS